MGPLREIPTIALPFNAVVTFLLHDGAQSGMVERGPANIRRG